MCSSGHLEYKGSESWIMSYTSHLERPVIIRMLLTVVQMPIDRYYLYKNRETCCSRISPHFLALLSTVLLFEASGRRTARLVCLKCHQSSNGRKTDQIFMQCQSGYLGGILYVISRHDVDLLQVCFNCLFPASHCSGLVLHQFFRWTR